MDSTERPNKIAKLSHPPSSTEHTATEPSTSPHNNNTTNPSPLPEVSSLLPSEPCTTAEPPAHLHREDDIEPTPHAPAPALSKTALKRLRRKEEWEATRGERTQRKKAKAKEKKEQQRAARASAMAAGLPAPAPTTETTTSRGKAGRAERLRARPVPMTFLLDCAFDALMTEGEVVSLGSQVTRCYHDVRHAGVQPLLAVSGFGGRLKERFDGLLRGQYKQWKSVRVMEEDCVEVSDMAKGWMRDIAAAIEARSKESPNGAGPEKESSTGQKGDDDASADVEPTTKPEIVYLSSESPNTIHTLSPHSTYIIGGLVDRNRHKGICYKTACEKGISTARLPIGEYVQMSSRKVLTTNHVVEIMLKWLETKDWGKAFVEVIPKRKGGTLKVQEDGGEEDADDEVDDQGEDSTRHNAETQELERNEADSRIGEEKTG